MSQPLSQEFEIKLLHIDPIQIESQLIKLGATKQFDVVYKRQVFDYPDFRLDANNSWIRLRDEGNKVTLTYKRRLEAAAEVGQSDAGMEELEVEVGDFDTTTAILLRTGLRVKHYMENQRIRYTYQDLEFDIDFWPLLDPYLEIEASSLKRAQEGRDLLGLDPKNEIICSTHQLYQQIGINSNQYELLTFTEQRLRTTNA